MELRHTTRRVSLVRKIGWLGVASMLAVALLAPAAGSVMAASGAIWTTSITCASPAPQDQNEYATGDHVYIRGSGLAASTTLSYSITGQPGGASSDPGIIVASGQVGTDATGYFCVDAYTILAGDDGTYTVDAGSKNDNYHVNGTVTTTTSTTATTTTSTTATTTTETTATTESTASSTSTSQSVQGETDPPTPAVTLPPTDAFTGPAAPSNDSWRILLIVGAALLASVLVLSPAKASGRR